MMQVHRTWAARAHSTAEATFLTDMRMSRNARGLLAELLALPDDAPRDIKTLSESCPDGRKGTASAFKELERYGYVTRTVYRHKSTGQLWTDVHIYDVPLETPEAASVDPGCQCSGDAGNHPNGGLYGVGTTSLPGPKALERDPDPVTNSVPVRGPAPEPESVPEPVADPEPGSDPGPDWEPEPQPAPAPAPKPIAERDPEPTSPAPTRAEVEVDAAARLLASLGRMDRRLSIGGDDAIRLAPFVVEWFARGATAQDIRYALTSGLPDRIINAPGILRNRLSRKMPLPPAPPEPVPVPSPKRGPEGPDPSPFIEAARRGAANVRAALSGALTPAPA